jgi:hypothetical protein
MKPYDVPLLGKVGTTSRAASRGDLPPPRVVPDVFALASLLEALQHQVKVLCEQISKLSTARSDDRAPTAPVQFLPHVLSMEEVSLVQNFIIGLIDRRTVPSEAANLGDSVVSVAPAERAETRLPTTGEEVSLVPPPSSLPLGFQISPSDAEPGQGQESFDREHENILMDFFNRSSTEKESSERRDFEQRCMTSDMKNEAACVIQHAVRTCLASRKDAIEKQIDAVLASLSTDTKSKPQIERILLNDQTSEVSSDCASSLEVFPLVPAFPVGKNAATTGTCNPTGQPRNVETVAVDQLVANLCDEAAFMSGSSFTFALRFNRFTIEPCRFIDSFSGCQAGDGCRFSHLRGAGREACIQ